MQSASASGCSDATTLMAARVFGPRPQELEATRPRVRARFNKPRNVARSCSGEGGSANIFPRVADLSVDLAPASVHKSVGVLRQVLAMAVRENRLVMNPVDGLELPAVGSVEQRFLTLEQLHALADARAPPGLWFMCWGRVGFGSGRSP